MAHLWIRDDTGEWAILPLDREAHDLRHSPPRRLPPAPAAALLAAQAGGERAVLLAPVGDDEDNWVLAAGPHAEVWVNGLPLDAGLRALDDRDQLRVAAAEPFFFSTERLAAVAPLPATPQSLFCPRCKQAVEVGSPAVCCPQCRLWHHQSEGLPCWLYARTCALCPQPTELAGGFRWTPEGL